MGEAVGSMGSGSHTLPRRCQLSAGLARKPWVASASWQLNCKTRPHRCSLRCILTSSPRSLLHLAAATAAATCSFGMAASARCLLASDSTRRTCCSWRHRQTAIWSLLPVRTAAASGSAAAAGLSCAGCFVHPLCHRHSEGQCPTLASTHLSIAAPPLPLYPAGVDPQLALFHRLPEGTSTGSGKELPWAYLSSKRPHSHDVRAVVAAGGRLFTGSNDTQLLSHSVDRYLKVGRGQGRETEN